MQNYNRNRQNFKSRSFSDYNSRKDNNHKRQPQPEGLAVAVRDGEDINRAIRRLKKKVERAGVLKEIRDRQYYEKPSAKRRKAKKAGIMRWKKKQRELEFDR